MTLSDAFLNSLVAEFDDANTVGFALGGSHVRGEASPYSDVDIARFVRASPDSDAPRHRMVFRGGHLISLSTKTVAEVRTSLTHPAQAIWVAPSIGQLHILSDKDGSLAALVNAVQGFQWPPLQDAANRYASEETADLAEEVHKIIAALLKSDEQAVLLFTRGLLSGITRLVAVQRGVMLKTEATYFPQVWQAMGESSAWTRDHRIAIGLDSASSGDMPPVIAGGLAGLRLYCETARLLRPILLLEHLEVIDITMGRIASSGLLGGDQ